MAGHKPWQSLIDRMSPERRAAFEAAAKEQRLGRLLAEMRKHTGLSQAELASRLGISQPGLSKMEGQEDMQISTLSRLVQSIGGSLELVVHMPDGDLSLTPSPTPQTTVP